MNRTAYTQGFTQRLTQAGYEPLDLPEPLRGQTMGALLKPEGDMRLALILATEDRLKSDEQSSLVAAVREWTWEQAERGQRTFAILVFPFTRKLPDETSQAILDQRVEDEQGRWGVIPWTADLDVELVDRHWGFPKVGDEVAKALTEVPRAKTDELWRQMTGPKVGRPRATLAFDNLPMTRLLVAITVGLYAATFFFRNNEAVSWFESASYLHGALVFHAGENWRLLTYTLLHAGLLHIGLNMYWLWRIGHHVEAIFGPWRMLYIYLVAGVCGGIASTAFRFGYVPSVGASGAVWGMIAAQIYAMRILSRGRATWGEMLAPAGMFILIGFFMPGIDNHAHIGGFAGGLLGAFLVGVPGQRDSWRQKAMIAVGAIILLLVLGILPLPHVVRILLPVGI